jgi:hypothetical protein
VRHLNYFWCLTIDYMTQKSSEKPLTCSQAAWSVSFMMLESACGTPFSTTLDRGEARVFTRLDSFARFDSGFPSCYILVSRLAVLVREPQDLEEDSQKARFFDFLSVWFRGDLGGGGEREGEREREREGLEIGRAKGRT